jgi:hypothetical protein
MRRISFYLLSTSIHRQYAALKQRVARRMGRRLTKEAGLIETAAAFTEPVVNEGTPAPPVVAPRTKSLTRKDKKFQFISRNWSSLTPACPECKMGNGYPKRSWPTREWAAEVWEKQHDRDKMDVYSCPVQPGFWHLGHRKEQSEEWKEHMFRLGFYMRCIGVQPQTCGLQAQYNALDPEQLKLARRTGRRLIKKAGTLAKAVAIFTTQISDQQVRVTEQKSLQGGLLTEDNTETLESLNETTEVDDWESYYDDDYELELDGDCNESQPCRGDEPGGDYYDDLYAAPPPSRIEVYPQRWWYPAKSTVRSYLRCHFPWLGRRKQVSNVVKEDIQIPF